MFNRHFYSGEGLQDDDRSGATVLVGHSYGGMAISEAAHAENVAALGYVGGFEPEKGAKELKPMCMGIHAREARISGRTCGKSLRQHYSITPYHNQPTKLALIVQFAAT